MAAGYFRFPTIYKDTVVFVSEDDLWTVPLAGGVASRLTAGLGEISWPRFSQDGRLLAFVGKEEGQPDIYVMKAIGGQPRRLTFLGDRGCRTAGWTDDGRIIFSSSAAEPFAAMAHLYILEPINGLMEKINVGPASAISFGPDGGVVIGQNLRSPAHWKRYRGGMTGKIWIDQTGSGQFNPLVNLPGNLDSPIWINDRIYFLSDHEGFGNIYSCTPSGEDIQRHTNHDDFYARNISSDGHHIVYHAGADMFVFDPSLGDAIRIPVDQYSSQTQRNRKFVSTSRYLERWNLHPSGKGVAIISRGKPYAFANWEGAVLQFGQEQGVRYRLLSFLNDGRRLIAVSDEGGEECFVIFDAEENGKINVTAFTDLDIGRPIALKVNPCKDQIAFSNHRFELFCLDLKGKALTLIDKSKVSRINNFDWSPDGQWVAYDFAVSLQRTALKLWRAEDSEVFPLTDPVLRDLQPSFDPGGKYLYFLSSRDFDPVVDQVQFDLGFPQSIRPYLIILQEDQKSPFIKGPDIQLFLKPDPKNKSEKENVEEVSEETGQDGDGKDSESGDQEEQTIKIDTGGIINRIVAFPVSEGIYGRILGAKDNKVLYSRFPVEGTLEQEAFSVTLSAKGILFSYDLNEGKEETLFSHVTDYDLNQDGSTLIYRSGNSLRVVKLGDKLDEDKEEPGKKSGWLDLSRVKVSIVPVAEWRQMFSEAWRLQRDHYWTPDMAKIDWLAVYDRYYPLLDRVVTRSEFSDLIWEMQGELGTSHAYEVGGDYRPQPSYNQGFLGLDFDYDETVAQWRIAHIVQGDVWDDDADSPLNKPGLGIKNGDYLLAINGSAVNGERSPNEALVNQAKEEVLLTIANHEQNGETGSMSKPHNVLVKTLLDETPARYREWVNGNRRQVFEATNGRVGYVHIPDMGPYGYSEFHRSYLAEIDRESLIIDVRYNRGGYVSSLLLEKLARKRIGYDISRWSEIPDPYPGESVLGPMVALTNEFAGSDGDIFSHSFKLMGLGPLIGKRTWGGVVGIWPRHPLVDGTVTTQPEYSFWFHDVGWGIENYGTDPDIEIDNTPQDYARGQDAQLEKAIAVILGLLEASPPTIPDFGSIPSHELPRLGK
jgi:tricorn protease